MMDRNAQSRPSRKIVDISFWLFHVALALGIALLATANDASVGMGVIVSLVTGAIAFVVYAVAIGLYVQEFNRLGILWSGIAFLLSPIGTWGTYFALFVLGDKLQAPKRPITNASAT